MRASHIVPQLTFSEGGASLAKGIMRPPPPAPPRTMRAVERWRRVLRAKMRARDIRFDEWKFMKVVVTVNNNNNNNLFSSSEFHQQKTLM
jgi:hypothetical protein